MMAISLSFIFFPCSESYFFDSEDGELRQLPQGKYIMDAAWGKYGRVLALTCKSSAFPPAIIMNSPMFADDGELYSWSESPDQAVRVTTCPPGVKKLFTGDNGACYLVY